MAAHPFDQLHTYHTVSMVMTYEWLKSIHFMLFGQTHAAFGAKRSHNEWGRENEEAIATQKILPIPMGQLRENIFIPETLSEKINYSIPEAIQRDVVNSLKSHI
jgi:hypothetical protein